ncbi:uncharacterized protein I206_107366 [Kwoniella pini CBS 10737]|uniref:DNA repair protein Swi5/Sae3 n=1 Tax=Kwoniella pini CBS 10737 TaxID=1296096 RepID=A0A1B9HX32_9TREE|nr:uncharacterized protein I206_05692 [Kwoniella pini CBS 10737]OCF47832.1 hypothetical protein I206_05692 [Kwoniella pini CBS 10737]
MSQSNSPSSSNSTNLTTNSLINSNDNISTKLIKDPKEERIKILKAELIELKIKLGDHNAYEIVQNHIKLLHEYNEIKDSTQILIGKYGQITGRTVRDIHVEMNLPLID